MPTKSATASQLRGKKPYIAPHLTPLALDEAKAKLTARHLAGDADAKQALERIAQLELPRARRSE